jgi:hypothetical protein
MFILYALPIGLLIGLLLGGRPAGLAAIRFRWPGLVLFGLVLQLILFFGPVAERIGDLGVPIYVGSSAIVLIALLRNLAIPGLPVIALGALLNLVAIVANGGYMPVSTGALAALGKSPATGYSNSTQMSDPALAPLTDIFALPPAVPFANVFSIGDLLIGLGIVIAIAVAVRGGASRNLPPTFATDSTDGR